MKNQKPTYEELEARLAEVESILEALESGQADAIVSKERVLVLRLREVEQALRESEARYRRILDSTNEGVWMLDLEGLTTYVNPQMAAVLGYKPAEMIGRSAFDFVWPEDIPMGQEEWQRRRTDTVGRQAEFRYRHKNGRPVWCLVNSSLILDAEDRPTGVLGMFTDITDRKRAEEALHASQKRLRTALNASGSAIYEHRLPLDESTYYDERWVEILGYHRQELPPSDRFLGWFFAQIHPDDRESLERAYQDFTLGRTEECQIQVRLRHKQGHWIWVEGWSVAGERDEKGRVRRVVGVMTDITSRKEAEKERERLLAERTAVMENMSDGLTLADPTGRIIYHNPASLALHGYASLEEALLPQEEVVDQWEIRDLSGQAVPLEEWPMPRALRGESFRGYELRVHRLDTGQEFIGSYSGSLVRSPGGEPLFAMLTVRDITQRKETEEALYQKHAQLEAILQQLPAAVIIAKAPSGELIVGNEQVKQIWKHEFIPVENIDQYDVYKGFHSDGRLYSPHEWPLARTIASGEFVENEEIKFQGGDGSFGWMMVNSAPIYDANGNITAGVVIFWDITERKRAEEALQRLNETLEQQVAERTAEVRRQADRLRAMTLQLSQTEQRERKRLTHIVHEHIQQLIVAAKFRVEWFEATAESERLQGGSLKVSEILFEVLEALRFLTIDLYPPVLDLTGLIGSLEWLAASLQEKNQFTVHLFLEEEAEPAAEELQFLLFQCARELLSNTMKHAGIQEAELTLVRTPDNRIRLTVRDKGQGFDPDLLQNWTEGDLAFGLFSIQERLAYLGGSMEIESAPGRGTRITLTTPVDEVS